MERRGYWRKLDENMDLLAQEMNRQMIADQLRQHDLISVDQYRHVNAMTSPYKANEYLLQLIRSEPPEYLEGLKDALMKAKQDELLDFLP